LVGCVWIPSQSQWLTSRAGKIAFIRRRIKRRGLLKAFDEALFYLLYHSNEVTSSNTVAANAMVKAYWDSVERGERAPSIRNPKITDPAVVEYLKELKPDVIFSHCIDQFFTKKLRETAPHGVFLWHVGMLPEYRGVYSPFWTMHNADFENFGYSLIRLNDELDAGEVFVQGRLNDVDIRHDNHHLIEHKAIFGSLPGVEQFLTRLENGTAEPILRPDAVSGYYSYPGITDYLRQRWRVHRELRRRARSKPAGVLSPNRSSD
jgi:folate-dependent phosphoribosylglycinamide formyltransferase PurN